MSWSDVISDVIKVIGGTAVVVAAIAWVAKSIITHVLASDLESFKQVLALEVERVKVALARVERLEADLLKSRGEAYGQIWRLTASLNLFGPITPIDNSELSQQLKNWYFERGWVLTQESKRRYFLVQEVLGFLKLRSIAFRRPGDEFLFGSESRPIELLRQMRLETLNIKVRGDEGSYSIEELETCVSEWKSQSLKSSGEDQSESAWILLQFVLSAFRSGIVDELGSREAVHRAT